MQEIFKRDLVLFIHFFLFVNLLCSQTFENDLRKALKSSPKFEFRLDSRNSFINTTSVRVFGIKAGIQYADKLSFGLGYNFLLSNIRKDIRLGNESIEGKLKFRMISPYIEYTFYRDEKWELSIPVQLGFGSSFYQLKGDGFDEKINRQFVISYEPAITFHYRVLRYFGLGMGVGYRLMLKHNSAVEEKFTSPVYLFKFKLYFQDLLKDIKKDNSAPYE